MSLEIQLKTSQVVTGDGAVAVWAKIQSDATGDIYVGSINIYGV